MTESNTRGTGGDAISLLIHDHRRVRKLLARLVERPEDSGKLLQQVENEITEHMRVEEEMFYPAFKDAVKSESFSDLCLEAAEDHRVATAVLREVKAGDAGSLALTAKEKMLLRMIESHIREEEAGIFSKARESMSSSLLQDLGRAMRDRKQQLGKNRAA